MLILSRKPLENIIIGDDIRITILDIKGNQARVGIEAPNTIKIYREEVYLAIQKENREAAFPAENISKLSGLFQNPDSDDSS